MKKYNLSKQDLEKNRDEIFNVISRITMKELKGGRAIFYSCAYSDTTYVKGVYR